MKKLSRALIALLIFILTTLACVTQTTPPTESTNVETVVAKTMLAITAENGVPGMDVTAAPPSGTPSLLPHPLYFLNTDSTGFAQVYRLETDGNTTYQVTFEPANVATYDVSPADGSVAYASNNQLLLVNADGSGRKLLMDGGTIDEQTPYLNRITRPVWSPNGQTIAYHLAGLNLYDVPTGTQRRVLEDKIDEQLSFPRELYFPIQYSPDGSKILLNMGHSEGGFYGIYDPNVDSTQPLSSRHTSCCSEFWTPDSTAVFVSSHLAGAYVLPGLWRIGADGSVTELLGGTYPGPFDFVLAPQLGLDGQLYYFYTSYTPEEDAMDTGGLPLYLVRSAPDGVTNRTNLIDTAFESIREVLWAPDASFAIVTSSPEVNFKNTSFTQIVYTDGRPNVSSLPVAWSMRWGP